MTTPAQRWSALHHGIDPDAVAFLGRWLRLMWFLARPLAARRVPPTAITVLGAALAVDAALLARHLPGVAALAVLAAVLCDGLDGAVAVLAGTATRSGAVADAVADRIGDVAFAAVVWRSGAPWWLAAVAGLLAVAVDAVRRMRRGLRDRITVAERPSWTVCTVLACVSATVTAARWPVIVCAVVWVGLGVVGLVQLVRARSGSVPAA